MGEFSSGILKHFIIRSLRTFLFAIHFGMDPEEGKNPKLLYFFK